MKIGIIASVVLFLVSCSDVSKKKSEKFIPKIDSVKVVYADSMNGPYIFWGIYSTSSVFQRVDSTSNKGEDRLDTIWNLKIQIPDTFSSPNAVHAYRYQYVDKRYVQIIGVPRK